MTKQTTIVVTGALRVNRIWNQGSPKRKFLLIFQKGDFSQVISQLYRTVDTPQPLYNTVHYNTVLDITRFKDGSQKCIDYIEK